MLITDSSDAKQHFPSAYGIPIIGSAFVFPKNQLNRAKKSMASQ